MLRWRGKNKVTIDYSLSFLSAFFLSQTPLLYSITAALSIGNVDSFQKVLSLAMCSVVLFLILLKILKQRLYVTKAFLIACCSSFIIFIFYFLTSIVYPSVPASYYSYFLAFCSYAVPSFVLGAILAGTKDPLSPFIKGIDVVSLMVSIATLVVLLTTNLTATVSELNKAGLNYQQFSYYAVYAYSLNLFFILSKSGATARGKIRKGVRILIVLTNVICALSGGGRGAVVLLFAISSYYIFYYFPWRQVNINKIVKFFCVASFAVFSFYYVVSKTTFIQSGIERLIILFTNMLNGKSEARNVSYAAALDIFWEKPVFGHGMGSVFTEWGFYLHNIFLDLAVETGLIGLILFVVLLLVATVDFHKLRKQDCRYDLIAVLFLNEFIMFLFSGYYLSGTRFWFCISFCIATARHLNRERKV